MQRIVVNPSMAKFRAALRKAGAEFPKRLQQVNKSIAVEVADDTRDAYRRSRFRQRSGDGARSIRALATQTRAQVAIGSARAPYLPGQNFGSNRVRQFAPKARPDRFLFATVEKRKPEIEKDHREMVDDLMREAYPD